MNRERVIEIMKDMIEGRWGNKIIHIQRKKKDPINYCLEDEVKEALQYAIDALSSEFYLLPKEGAVERIAKPLRERLERFVQWVDKDGIVDWGDGKVIKHIGLPSIDEQLAQAIIAELEKE